MKKIVLIFLVFLTITKSFAQSTGIVVSVEKTKVLYNEIENLFEVSKIPKNSKITIEGCNAILKKVNALGSFTILPKDTGYIKVYLVKNNSKSLLSSIKVIDLPDPYFLLFDGSTGGTMAAERFRVQPGIRGDFRDFVYEGVRVVIQSFTIICKNADNKDFIIRNVIGPSLRNEATAEMKPGSEIIITDIIYKVNNGKTRKSNSHLTFKLM
jgi:hypothetical protein